MADHTERARRLLLQIEDELDKQNGNAKAIIDAALAAAERAERQRQIARVAFLRNRDDDDAPPRNLVEEITAAFPVEDWADILASALSITEPTKKNAIVRTIAAAHAAFTADEVTAAERAGAEKMRERASIFAFEQRCERGTPWDMACAAIGTGISNLSVDGLPNAEKMRALDEAVIEAARKLITLPQWSTIHREVKNWRPMGAIRDEIISALAARDAALTEGEGTHADRRKP